MAPPSYPVLHCRLPDRVPNICPGRVSAACVISPGLVSIACVISQGRVSNACAICPGRASTACVTFLVVFLVVWSTRGDTRAASVVVGAVDVSSSGLLHFSYINC